MKFLTIAILILGFSGIADAQSPVPYCVQDPYGNLSCIYFNRSVCFQAAIAVGGTCVNNPN